MRDVWKLETLISGHYARLSRQQRLAADFILSHRLDVATRSMRQISASSGLPPATFTRLAKSLDLPGYETLREAARDSLADRPPSFGEKASVLQSEAHGDMLAAQVAASKDNIDALDTQCGPGLLDEMAEILANAGKVGVLGALSSAGIAAYLLYLGRYFSPAWHGLGHAGGSIAADLSAFGAGDALIGVTLEPFARQTCDAVRIAAEMGVSVIIVTNSHRCPALPYSERHVILSTDSPQFFSSYASTVVLLEALVGRIVARGGKETRDRIEQVTSIGRDLAELLTD